MDKILEALEKCNKLVEDLELEEADNSFNELLKMVDETKPSAIDVYFDYATFKDIAGTCDYKKAIKYGTKAYKLNKKLYKENNNLETLLKQAEIADFLGDLYYDTDKDKMVKYYNDAIKIWKKNLDKEKDYKLFIACDALDMGKYEDEKEDYGKAFKYFRLTLKMWNKYLKEEPNEEYDIDKITKDIYKGYADFIYLDDMDKAISLYKKVIKLCKKYLSTDMSSFYGYDYADSLYKLSDLYYDDETYVKALKYLVELDKYLKDTDDEEYLEIAIEAVKKLGEYYDSIDDYDNAKKYATKFFNYAKKQYEINNEKILDYADASYEMTLYSDAIKYKALALGLAYDFDGETKESKYWSERFRSMVSQADNIEEDADTWLDLYDKKYKK